MIATFRKVKSSFVGEGVQKDIESRGSNLYWW